MPDPKGDKSLAMELTRILIAHEPGLLVADPEAIARSAGQLSALTGCVLAGVLVKQPRIFEASVAACEQAIRRNAQRTADGARRREANVTPQ